MERLVLKNKPRQLERALTVQLWTYLNYRQVFCWIVFQPALNPKKTSGLFKFFHRSTMGVPDILGIYDGRLLGIEVKIPKGSYGLTENQKGFQEKIRAHGGIAFEARSIEDIDRELFKKGKSGEANNIRI